VSAFDDMTADEIMRLVGTAPIKHCSLDPAPTWLMKCVLPLLADTFAKICNTCFRDVVFPQNLKQALVRPRLKKSTLDPDDLNTYRPITNLTFLSKPQSQRLSSKLQLSVLEVMSSKRDFFLIASRPINNITRLRLPSSPCMMRSSRR